MVAHPRLLPAEPDRPLLRLLSGLAPTQRWLAAALALAGGELMLRAAHEQGVWAHDGFPWHGRLLLVLATVVVWIAVTWPVHWIFRGAELLRARRPVLGACTALVAAGSLDLLLLAYLASWIAMWRTGFFPDADALYFATRNLGLLIQYLAQAEPHVLGLLTTAAIVGAGVSAIAACRRSDSPPQPVGGTAWRVGDGCIVMALAMSQVAALAVFYGDRPLTPDQMKEWWKHPRPGRNFALAYRLHPLIHNIWQ